MFTITRRHYDAIIHQANTNYPQESGGFIGGKDTNIKAILPIYNQHLGDKTGTFSVMSEDILRAHEFFNNHNLDYFGIYHTHPKASAKPSDQDLRNVQKFMFIISLRHKNKPDFACYIVDSGTYQRHPLKIIDGGYESVDLFTKQTIDKIEPTSKSFLEELNALEKQFHDITIDQARYPKLKPRLGMDNSGFSTLA